MPVVINKPDPNTLRVVATVDITAIMASVGVSNQEKKAQAMRLVQDAIATAVQVDNRTDAEIDADVARATAEATRLKTARATGTF